MSPKPFTFLFTLALLLVICRLQAQSFHAQFSELLQQNDTTAEKALLKKWHAAQPGNAELYVAYFNYYFQKGRFPVVSLSKQKPSGESFAMTKEGETKPSAYLSEGEYGYNQQFLDKAFQVIDTAIAKYPNRLDMRFGKTYLLGELSIYDQFTDEIIKTLDYAQTNNNHWTWADNKAKPDGMNFMLSTIQSYTIQLYNAGDAQLSNMERLCLAVLKYYPNRIEALSDLSIAYMLEKKYDDALMLLLKAEQLNPKDYVVHNNIAYCYKLKGDKANAAKYYNLVIKYGPDQARKEATESLKELN